MEKVITSFCNFFNLVSPSKKIVPKYGMESDLNIKIFLRIYIKISLTDIFAVLFFSRRRD